MLLKETIAMCYIYRLYSVPPLSFVLFLLQVEDMERAAGDGVVEFNEMDDDW